MNEEERLKLENELLFTKSKAQMINLYLDKLQELDQYKNNWEELKTYLIEESKFDEYKDITYRETMGYVLDKVKELEEE